MNKRILLIVNPFSGKAKMKNELLNVVQILSSNGDLVTVYPTKDRLDATKFVAQLNEDEFDLIVVCGGDGTLNEVITGLSLSGKMTTLGYIPSGTLNEWSSGLNISRNITQAAKDIIGGKEIFLDIGRFDDRFFSYTASFGAFTDVSYSAPQDVKNVLGQAAYFFEGIKSLGNINPVNLKIETEDRVCEGKYLFGAISNSFSVGGIVKFDETAVNLNDGMFEVLLIHNPENIFELQSVIDGIIKRDFNRSGIEFFTANKIKVTEEAGVSWTLDGEYAEGKSEFTVENIHNGIRLLVH